MQPNFDVSRTQLFDGCIPDKKRKLSPEEVIDALNSQIQRRDEIIKSFQDIVADNATSFENNHKLMEDQARIIEEQNLVILRLQRLQNESSTTNKIKNVASSVFFFFWVVVVAILDVATRMIRHITRRSIDLINLCVALAITSINHIVNTRLNNHQV